jgi:hypothetical protein
MIIDLFLFKIKEVMFTFLGSRTRRRTNSKNRKCEIFALFSEIANTFY